MHNLSPPLYVPPLPEDTIVVLAAAIRRHLDDIDDGHGHGSTDAALVEPS